MALLWLSSRAEKRLWGPQDKRFVNAGGLALSTSLLGLVRRVGSPVSLQPNTAALAGYLPPLGPSTPSSKWDPKRTSVHNDCGHGLRKGTGYI